MEGRKIRVRFAPSPTGGLHIGGIRTVLFNWLFARRSGGDFIVRIEDTDQTRFVPGAEEYIFECLRWCGLEPDESPVHGGPFGPYRQSERKAMYRQYADQLVADGFAYCAFDTPEELQTMRDSFRTEENPSPQYDARTRMRMRNSLSLPPSETERLLAEGTPHVVRIRIPDDETVSLDDMVRGTVTFHSSQSDDKVLLKADGMPTYHLAVVVDDRLMQITHAFRGEEWLPSAPVHLLLWKYLGWENEMPRWAHLPLILRPDGNGKLSKRDGDRLGIPVFAMDWKNPASDEVTRGFRETGFLPEAFLNMLAMLGWNDGTGREVMSLDELIDVFSMDRVHKGGARFDYGKAKWFNQEWIRRSDTDRLLPDVRKALEDKDIQADDEGLRRIIPMVKERCELLTDFPAQAGFFFRAPETLDTDSIRPRWDDGKAGCFRELASTLQGLPDWEASCIEAAFKESAAKAGIKPGELQLPFRIMLVGGKFGPPVFDIAATIGRDASCERIRRGLEIIGAGV